MQIFDELVAWGVKDLGILSMDGERIEEGAKAVFRMLRFSAASYTIRNSIRYIPRKQWSAFTKQLKLHLWCHQRHRPVRNSRSSRPTGRLIQARSAYGKTISRYEQFPITMAACAKDHVYTTNAIESVNSSFPWMATKKGAFPNEDAVFKIFTTHPRALSYGRVVTSQTGRWSGTSCLDDRMSQLMQQYDVVY